jgi:feruloyl esterase
MSGQQILIRGTAAALVAAAAASLTAQEARPAAQACETLRSVSLPHTAVTTAVAVANGGTLPSDGGNGEPPRAPRAFCRVAATLTPSADSDIKMEVWMPTDWNGKFQAVGNGAFNGNMPYPAMRTALGRGYAVAGTDTGHTGNSAAFALGHPEKLVDFGWRAVHETTVTSKQIVAAHYARAAERSYWVGCSAGGRQGMQEALRFPADFDGIVAGAPGLDWTGRAAQANHVAQAIERDPAGAVTEVMADLLHKHAIERCDAADGLKDGLIADPRGCRADPASLQCKTAGETGCLTPSQVKTATLIYASRKNPASGREIGGLLPGSEPGWTQQGWTASARASGLSQFRFIVFKDPAWTLSRFDFDRDIVRAETEDAGIVNALDTNLAPFFGRGGKLIQYHGWADPQISPMNAVQYYGNVVSRLGAATVQNAYRLFMAPGMAHCSGGEGPNSFDMLAALEAWVEQGRAPDRVLASHATRGVVDRRRPLCPFPQVASYTGAGSIDDAETFVCKTP